MVFEYNAGLQHHLNALHDFLKHQDLKVNLGKTKAMIFHSSMLILTDKLLCEESQLK